MKVNFLGTECTVEFQEYAKGGVAIQLWSEEDGPMGKATICLPDYPLKENQVIIKDYAENTGMLKALVDAGVVKDTGDVAPSGYIVGNVCDLLVRPE